MNRSGVVILNPSFIIPSEKVPDSKRIIADRDKFFSKANIHRRKAIDCYRGKDFWGALLEEALYFHEMRICEVFLRDDKVQDAKRYLEFGIFNQEEYNKSLKKADEFLASWSDKNRVMLILAEAFTRLKLDEQTRESIASDVVRWSLEGGNKDDMIAIVEKYNS